MNSITSLFLISALALPLLLLPIEQAWPYPYLWEELAKLVAIAWLMSDRRSSVNSQIGWIILFGIIFTISESTLYLMNIFTLGTLSDIRSRLLLTGFLHLTTTTTIYLTWKSNKWLGLVGLVLAIIIHYVYNAQIAVFFDSF